MSHPVVLRLRKKLALCLAILSGRKQQLTAEEMELLDIEDQVAWSCVQEVAEDFISSLLEGLI